MPPPDHHYRQEDFAGYEYRPHAYEPACRQFLQEFQARMPTGSRLIIGRAILCGIIRLTFTA
jgi:hypothetical protein